MVPSRKPLEIILEFISANRESREFAWEEAQYRVRHTNGDGASVHFSWQEPWLRSALKSLDQPEPGAQVLERLGRCLGDFLRLTNWARDRDAIEKALSSGQPVHLTICTDNADELYSLPWELLPLSSKTGIAGLEDCLLQYERLPRPEPTRAAPPAGRILFAYAMAGDWVPADAHLNAIRTACEEANFFFDPDEDVLHVTSRESLVKKLEEKERPVTALHLLCHGAQVSDTAYGLMLDPMEPSGRGEVISAPDLRNLLFPHHRPFLRLVTLCSCQGGDAGTPAHPLGSVARMFHEQRVPAVIASRLPLSCEGSVILAETLYKELLGEGGNLRTALSAVRKKLKTTTTSRDWVSLQFYARARDEAALYPFGSPPPPPPAKASRELVLVRHEAYKRVTEEPEPSSAPEIFDGRQPRRVEIDQTPALEGREWKNLDAEVKRLASPEGELRSAFSERDTDVVYYGFPYVPLAVLAGYLAKKRRVQVLECVDDRFSWDSQASGPALPLQVDAARREAGSVAQLRFSVSAPVNLEDCRQVLPEQDVKLDLHFRLEKQARNSVRREAQLQAYVKVIRDALTHYILNDNSRFESIHIFAAVPVSLAFNLGRELSGTTWLPKCFVYNYGIQESPRNKWRLCLDDAYAGKRAVKIFK